MAANTPQSRPIASTFQIVEAYKMLRTNLLFSLSTCDNKVVVISSAEPSAGKSTVAANLSITMAQTGAKVLLIDGDMRRPTQHKTFRVKRQHGLSMVLSNLATFEDCVFRDVAKNLDLLCSGSTPPNPSELLGSEMMNRLLEQLQTQYDYIFLDVPPLCVVSDGLIVGSKAAGMMLVCRQRQTQFAELQEAVRAVRDVEENLLGIVITDMRRTPQSYKHYNNSRYYKRYNYSYTESNNGTE